jgi:hypothetical protein
MMDSVVLGTYKSELREFRALQEELQPWTAAFRAKNDRKPCLADVESTRAPHTFDTTMGCFTVPHPFQFETMFHADFLDHLCSGQLSSLVHVQAFHG